MKLSKPIIEMLKAKTGLDFRSPSDCTALSQVILTETRCMVSTNTLKRLLGIVDDERAPHTYTLDAIAQFIGSENWDTLQKHLNEGNSDFVPTHDEIRSCDLQPQTGIKLTYHPDRYVTISYLGNDCYRVTESQHSKLHAGDVIKVSHLVKGFPLLVSSVIRNGENLGSFTAGETSGIDFDIL